MIPKENTIYATPEFRIGKHEWRCVVYMHDSYGPCTLYQWRSVGYLTGNWRHHRDWPKYDHNDTYDGLPRSLNKLYRKYYAEIQAALGKAPKPDAQKSML